MAFSFGATAPKTTATSFGGFGTTATQPFSFGTSTSQPTGFGFGATATTTTATTGFSFGKPAATTTAFSFGTPAFGASTTTTASTGFGFGTGLQTTSASTGFGNFSLGASKPAFAAPFGGFGTTPATNAAPAAAAPSQDAVLANMATALSTPTVYNDDRDTILSKWNRVQAFWGVGSGYYSSTAQPITFSPDNPFCRFKAIGYSCLPKCKNEDGNVALVFNKKEIDVKNNQQQIKNSIHAILQSKPTLNVCVEGTKSLVDDKTELTIYVMETAANGTVSRISATDFYAFANQPNNKTQFNNLGVIEIIPKAAPTADQLKVYLENPPSGIDPLIWQQAKLDNPDPDNLIPVPMIGFSELQRRLKCQTQETKLHQGRLDLIATDVSDVQKKHSAFIAKLEDIKRKQLELSHRVLKVMVKQEISRKLGFGIQNDEEQLRVQLEAIYSELSAPTQFKGRLSELMSQIRMQSQDQGHMSGGAGCKLDAELADDFKCHLKQQQLNLVYLKSIINNAFEDLKVISDCVIAKQVT